MSDRMPEYMSDRMSDRLPEYMSDRMSDRLSEYILYNICPNICLAALPCHGGDHTKSSVLFFRGKPILGQTHIILGWLDVSVYQNLLWLKTPFVSQMR